MNPESVCISLMTADEVPDSIRSRLNSGTESVHENGMIYARAGGQYLCCEDNEAGENLIRALNETRAEHGTVSDPWQKILRGEVSGGILRDGVPRCVIVFRASVRQERSLLDELIPLEPGDAITENDGGTVLIKKTDGLTDEEIVEFAAAVTSAAETEAGIRLQAGIGRPTRKVSELKDSYSEAESAIDMGRHFLSGESVYAFGHLAAERLISAVPAADRVQLRKELFTPETRKLLTSEMMETIDAFFRNDLNLSTTAREMFIHRNTLIYRLDKIRKVTGYDLRHFQDAMAFRLLSRLPENDE